MENNSISRQLKIDLITDTPNDIIVWFNELWLQILVIETNVYHNNGGEIIYYINDNHNKQWIFFREDITNQFWCNYNYYWRILDNKYDIKYSDIQCVTKVLVENVLNTNNTIKNVVIPPPTSETFFHTGSIDNALNNI